MYNYKIVILGGGTAGWLTALFLKKNFKNLDITLVENPKQPPIIAGESGNVQFTTVMRNIGIDLDDFVRKVNATPKLGGRFKNWSGLGSEFIHALQTDYAPWLDGWTNFYGKNETRDNCYFTRVLSIVNRENEKSTYLKTIIGNNIHLSRGLFAAQFIEQNKVPFGAFSELPCVPMWHFESRSAAAYFKELALQRGINLVEGVYTHSDLNEKNEITTIHFDDGRSLSADWFFDCSGFARLLLGKVYQEKIIDYTNYFPARAVIAWWDKPVYSVTTNATALKYGWSWNINLRHRSGNGYIYDPDHLTYDQALQEIHETFGNHIEPIANFSYTPGMMRNTWKNNVIGIGLSSGFLEPLEANGIAVIIESLYSLQDFWNPDKTQIIESRKERFNDRVWQTTEDIKDFLSLHYRGNRKDTEFWLSHTEDRSRIPDTLKEKLEEWNKFYQGIEPEPFFHGYSPAAWLMVLQGLKIFDHTPLKEKYSKVLETGKEILNISENEYKNIVKQFWTIDDWIKNTE